MLKFLRKQLVIQSKWECPNFDFTKKSPTQTSIAGISVPKGMWHQRGDDAEVARVEILPPDSDESMTSLPYWA